MITRILLVDDHKIFLAGLSELINNSADMQVVATAADAQLIESMFKAGASAFVLKDCELAELVAAVKKVTAGETYMSGSVAEVVAASFRQQRSNAPKEREVKLSKREQQVLVMLADGLTTKKIASKLDLSVKTIGTYREHLMEKLDIHSVAGLTKYAIRKGLVTND